MPPELALTEEQRAAVTVTGKSVIVSAAAGSGKTTVLAERCAYLVCDAPSHERCNVDQLVVLTFTDAAATQMRSRIMDAIRGRSQAQPGDARLREQLLLAETAQISTIHSFCLWIVRRWFPQVGVDPMASVMDADEAAILKKEVVSELFERLYAQEATPGTPFGEDRLGPGHPADSPRAPSSFSELVDVYALGEDRPITEFVLRLYEFTTSLPDPDAWLNDAHATLTGRSESVLSHLVAELERELEMQIPHCQSLVEAIKAGPASGHDYAECIQTYGNELSRWLVELKRAGSPGSALDSLRTLISDFQFDKVDPLRGQTEDEKKAREAASRFAEEARRIFKKRIKERFGFFTAAQWVDGMAQVAPSVALFTRLVREFRTEYSRRKQRLNVLDFADLERFAYEVLRDGNEPSVPARELRKRFAHVLVDEFQDINPLQEAILRAVSRDGESLPGNLFSVGDVKQSIYRFRLAEPQIFLNRLQQHDQDGSALFLQQNFRSRPEILEAVNFLFGRLMNASRSGPRYDTRAHLQPARDKPTGQTLPVELHLLPRQMDHTAVHEFEVDGDEEPPEDSDESAASIADERPLRRGDPPSRWDSIMREAYVIGTRIREIIAKESATGSGKIRYSDIAVLLRATRANADRVAAVLGALGIPAHAEVGGSLTAALEVRDVLAALHILDNFQQDIPLAGVLRSGIFGDRFTEDDLVEIRVFARHVPFHAAVRIYARNGPQSDLRERLVDLLRRIQSYRDEVTRRPLAQTLWNLMARHGYMDHALGLPNGQQRRANLLKLYDLARGFHSQRKQGLHRFLRMIESMADQDQPIAVATAPGGGDDVVRIMSIHHAKGMEFPIVFVAGLGERFNLGDGRGRMVFERKSRIGLRAIDTTRMLEYPTAVHQLVVSEVNQSAKDEELRILYVAMTRAKEQLILIGSSDKLDKLTRAVGPPTAFRVATALCFLDWILPVLGSAPSHTVRHPAPGHAQDAIFHVVMHQEDEIAGWSLGFTPDSQRQELQRIVSRLEPIAKLGPDDALEAKVEQTLRRVRRVYPWLAASSIKATMPASAFGAGRGGRWSEWESIEIYGRKTVGANSPGSAKERGILTHRALQFLDLDAARDSQSVRAELDRLTEKGVLNQTQRKLVLEDEITWFVGTDLAETLRQAADSYRRELRFLTCEPLSAHDPTLEDNGEDRLLVRGMVDGIVVREDGCEIIDFKTDVVAPEELGPKCETYRTQLKSYARAVERLWRRPVNVCRLVFLSARTIIDLTPGQP